MIDYNDHIRKKLREAREEASLSQRELAEMVHSAQGTISDLERGRIRINAADLARFADILGKPIQFFYPDVQESDLTEREQILIRLFRKLSDTWQQSILVQIESQVAIHTASAESKDASKRIEQLPKDEREDAAYDTVYSWLRPLLRLGLRIHVDEEGNASLSHPRIPGLRIPVILNPDEDTRQIMLEIKKRHDLHPDH